MSVDLPAPLAPTRPWISPRPRDRSMPATAIVAPYRLRSPTISMAGDGRRSHDGLGALGDVGHRATSHWAGAHGIGSRSGVASSGMAAPSSAMVVMRAVTQGLLGDEGRRHHDGCGDLLLGGGQCRGPDRDPTDVGRIGADRGDPGAAIGGDDRDVRGGDVGAVDLDLVLETGRLDGQDGTLRELVIGREDGLDVGVGQEHGGGLGLDLGGGGLAHGAEGGHVLEARVGGKDLLEHRVAAVEGREAGHVDIGDVAGAAGVRDQLLQAQPGDVRVGLLDLGHGGVVGVDVERDDRDAGRDGGVDARREGLGGAVVEDDRGRRLGDGGLEVLGVGGVVAVGAGDEQVDAQVGGLCLGAGEPLLEVVARAQLADEGDLDRRRVERRRRRDGRASRRRLSEDGGRHEECGGSDAGGPAGQPRPTMRGGGMHVCGVPQVSCDGDARARGARQRARPAHDTGPRSPDTRASTDAWERESGDTVETSGSDVAEPCPFRSGSAFAARAWDLDEKRSDYLAARASMVPGSAGRHIGQHICAWVVMRLRMIAEHRPACDPRRTAATARSWPRVAARDHWQASGDPVAVRAGVQDRVGQAGDAHREGRVAGRDAAAAGHDHLASAAPRCREPRGQLVGRPQQPVGAGVGGAGCRDGTRDVARPWVDRLDLAPVALAGTHIEERQLTEPARAAPPARWSAASRRQGERRRRRARPASTGHSSGCPGRPPRRDATVEHPDRAMPQRVEHPPQSGCRHARSIVIGDDRGVRCRRPARPCVPRTRPDRAAGGDPGRSDGGRPGRYPGPRTGPPGCARWRTPSGHVPGAPRYQRMSQTRPRSGSPSRAASSATLMSGSGGSSVTRGAGRSALVLWLPSGSPPAAARYPG